jgi:hypothetical protein
MATIPQININSVLANTMDPVTQPLSQDPGVVSREPGTAAAPIIPPTGSRVGRIARKPINLVRRGLRLRHTTTSKADPAAQAREQALAARGRTRPREGERAAGVLRVRVVRCEGLVVRDRKSSDP